jgi:uncharacterized membrane protein
VKKKLSWIVFLMFSAVLFLSSCGSEADEEKAETAGGLCFDISELSEEPSFIDWNQGGTAMQLIALKAGDEVRLAFNTCQSCQGSPWAWFEYLDNGMLQCHNCGQVFGLETVGTPAASGCNPITITDFTVNGSTVTVSESFLKEQVELFKNWKWGES